MKLFYILIALLFLFASCSKNYQDGLTTYEPYGLLNKDDKKVPAVKYELCIGNLVWGCLLVETIIAPVYFFGFDLWEPVGMK